MSKYFMKNNEKSARSHPRIPMTKKCKPTPHTVAPTTITTTTAVSKSPFRTS